MNEESPKEWSWSMRAQVAAAVVLLGCGLPYAADRWLWSPIDVEVVNGETASLDGIDLEGPEGVLHLGTLAAGAHASLRVRGVRGRLTLLFRHTADPDGQRILVQEGCRRHVQVVLHAKHAPQFEQESPAWARWML